MSSHQNLAEHGVALCVFGLGLASAGGGGALTSAAVVGAALSSIWRDTPRSKRRAARDAGMAKLSEIGISDREAEIALHFLEVYDVRFEVDPATLKDARTRGNFPQTLYDTMFDAEAIPPYDRVPESLMAIVEGAWDVLRLEDDVHKLFTQESLTEVERLLGSGLEALREQVATDVAELKVMVADLQTQIAANKPNLSQTAQTLLDNESLIVALAFRYAEGNPEDFDAALRGLERALEVAAEERARGQLPANTDDAVNAVIAQVDALNEAGRLDTAAALILEEEERTKAGLVRLYDKGIAQAVLTRDVDAAVAYELKKMPLEVGDGEDYAYLRDVFFAWHTRGEKKGLNFDAEVAIALMRDMVRRFEREQDNKGACLMNLGIALWTLGQRESGTARLEEAVASCLAALEERTRERVPQDWARAMVALGNALVSLGERESGIDKLQRAVDAYRAALENISPTLSPTSWARANMNLGSALGTLGQRDEGTSYLDEAAEAYRAALMAIDRKRAGQDWARAQMNLGNVLSTLGERRANTAAIREAVVAYRAALQEWTQTSVPLDWSMAQMNLGTALTSIGLNESGVARLQEAVEAYRAALAERTRDRVPLSWATTQMNLGIALRAIGERNLRTEYLVEANAAFGSALEEFTHESNPLKRANTLGNQALAILALSKQTQDLEMARLAELQLSASEQLLRKGGHAVWANGFLEELSNAKALIATLSGDG